MRWYLRGISWGLVLGALLQTGCALVLLGGGAAVGAGTVAYLGGELRSTEQVPLDGAWQAAQGAVEELEFSTVTREKDVLEARLVARGAGDKKVEVHLKKLSPVLTEVGIRVNLFGDEQLSRLVLDAMRRRY